eukprot:2718384-Amphidinium_carterae.1
MQQRLFFTIVSRCLDAVPSIRNDTSTSIPPTTRKHQWKLPTRRDLLNNQESISTQCNGFSENIGNE